MVKKAPRPKNTAWHLFPDELVEINWETARRCLSAQGKKRELVESPLFGKFFNDAHYKVLNLEQVASCNTPCCQIADLFTGLALFSKTHYNKYQLWCDKESLSFGFYEEEEQSLSNSEEERFKVLRTFNSKCKINKVGVSLNKWRCLRTRDHRSPLNFWHYESQHVFDKAPVKAKA